MSMQDLVNKRGEVEFRRKLFRQQVEGERIFADEFDADGIAQILEQRMADTVVTMQELRASGVVISPYLEIGAERGQRSLAMENDLGARGAALDLSLDLLTSCEHYAARFDRPLLPLRVCADVYRLPFATDSLPFVFCYQTLHHFPSLEPVVREIHRVLAPGGHFFFAEEPYHRVLHMDLIRARGGVRTAPRGRLRKLLRNLFVRETFNEEDHGVIENHDIPLRDWRRAMSIFSDGRSTLELDRLRVHDTGPRNRMVHLALTLLGGRISGLYRKAGQLGRHAAGVEEALVAPAGSASEAESPLRPSGDDYVSTDGERFISSNGVAVLMPRELLVELYPELSPA